MKKFNSSNLLKIRTEINNALNEVSKKLDINLSIGHIGYTNTSFRVKLNGFTKFSDNNNTSYPENEHTYALKTYGSRYNLSEKDYGRKFVLDGKTYKLVGLAPRSPKFPIIAESVKTGKTYKFRINVFN